MLDEFQNALAVAEQIQERGWEYYLVADEKESAGPAERPGLGAI